MSGETETQRGVVGSGDSRSWFLPLPCLEGHFVQSHSVPHLRAIKLGQAREHLGPCPAGPGRPGASGPHPNPVPQGDCTPSSIGALLSTAPGALSAKVTHLLSKLRGSRPLLQFSRPLSGPHTNPQTSQASLPHIRCASSHNSLCLEGFNSTPLQPSYRQPAGHLLQGAPPPQLPQQRGRGRACALAACCLSSICSPAQQRVGRPLPQPRREDWPFPALQAARSLRPPSVPSELPCHRLSLGQLACKGCGSQTENAAPR